MAVRAVPVRGVVVSWLVLALSAGAAQPSGAAATAETPVVIRGVGAAHGFGMAMDGVEGQARAGWSHDQILSLFYPGTTTSQAGGTIRVGLAEAETVALSVPNGGTVSNAAQGAGGSPVTLPGGKRVTLRVVDGGIAVDGISLTAAPKPTKEPSGQKFSAAQQEPPPAEPTPPSLLPTPPPPPPGLEPSPSAPPTKKKPGEPPTTSEREVADAPKLVVKRVWAWGSGDPALVAVDATGRRYRGTIEVFERGGKLTVVNHVDLETYVRGIAEEKGQGWPLAGLKALAIAARSLGAATMTWYTKNTANGYDICPDANCQLYLGYDGEEPSMSQAVAETAGQIRTFSGRPILAMYHGNGGGQTESYKTAIGGGSDPHPYLTSVKYPYAAPSTWRHRTTLGEVDGALRAEGVAVPGALGKIEVVDRGESPRVMSMRLSGSDGDVEVTGTRFAHALGLRSTWFDLSEADDPESFATSEVIEGTVAAPPAAAQAVIEERSDWALPVLIGASCVLALAGAMTLRTGRTAAVGVPLRSFAGRLRGGRGRVRTSGGRLRGLAGRARSRFRRLPE